MNDFNKAFVLTSYTLPKQEPKKTWITWHTLWIPLISAFYTRNRQVLRYEEIQTWYSYTLPKEGLKSIWITWHTLCVPVTSTSFIGNQQILLSQEIRIEIAFLYMISNFLNFFWLFLINMVSILMVSAKLATLDFLKIKVFWNEICDVITSVDDVTNRILSGESSFIAVVIMWPKFGSSSISMREVITTSTL